MDTALAHVEEAPIALDPDEAVHQYVIDSESLRHPACKFALFRALLAMLRGWRRTCHYNRSWYQTQ